MDDDKALHGHGHVHKTADDEDVINPSDQVPREERNESRKAGTFDENGEVMHDHPDEPTGEPGSNTANPRGTSNHDAVTPTDHEQLAVGEHPTTAHHSLESAAVPPDKVRKTLPDGTKGEVIADTAEVMDARDRRGHGHGTSGI